MTLPPSEPSAEQPKCRCGNPTAPGIHRLPGSPVPHCDAEAGPPPRPAVAEDRCCLSADCDAPFETTIVGWLGGTGWVYDACWSCARRVVDVMTGWRLLWILL